MVRDYSKGFIYKLTCNDINVKEIYVGSSTNMKQRKKGHKDKCNSINQKSYNSKVYTYIRANGGWNNWSLIWIKDYPSNSKRELEAEEDKIMRELKATLNSTHPVMNKEERKQNNKKYRETHKEQKSKMDKEWREKNEEKLKSYFKKHYKNNKDNKIKYAYDYRKNNKEKISNKAKEKITCECGTTSNKCALPRHRKSKKHQVYDFLKYIEESISS